MKQHTIATHKSSTGDVKRRRQSLPIEKCSTPVQSPTRGLAQAKRGHQTNQNQVADDVGCINAVVGLGLGSVAKLFSSGCAVAMLREPERLARSAGPRSAAVTAALGSR